METSKIDPNRKKRKSSISEKIEEVSFQEYIDVLMESDVEESHLLKLEQAIKDKRKLIADKVRQSIKVGDWVEFESELKRESGTIFKGQVEKINPASVRIKTIRKEIKDISHSRIKKIDRPSDYELFRFAPKCFHCMTLLNVSGVEYCNTCFKKTPEERTKERMERERRLSESRSKSDA